jgi:hypothetical protein
MANQPQPAKATAEALSLLHHTLMQAAAAAAAAAQATGSFGLLLSTAV